MKLEEGKVYLVKTSLSGFGLKKFSQAKYLGETELTHMFGLLSGNGDNLYETSR